MRTRQAGALVLGWVILGCGGGGQSDPADASTPQFDAAPPAIDAATEGPLTVRVRDGADNPIGGAPVLLHDAAGTEYASGITNSSGEFTVPDMPVSGAVTVVRLDESNALELDTVFGVQPNDVITFRNRPNAVLFLFTTFYGSLNVTLPPTAAQSVDEYVVTAPCRHRPNPIGGGSSAPPSGNPGETVSLQIHDDCPSYDPMSFVAYGLLGGERVLSKVNRAFTAGAAPTLGSSNLGAPDAVSTVNLIAPAATVATNANVVLAPRVDGLTFDFQNDDVSLAGGTTTPVPFRIAHDLPDTLEARMRLEPANPPATFNTASNVTVAETAALQAGMEHTISLDFHFPFLSSFTVSGNPSAVAWTSDSPLECGALGAADVTVATLVGRNVSNKSFRWTLVSGGGGSSSQIPSLSVQSAAAYWPEASFTELNGVVAIAAFESLDYDTYRNGNAANRLTTAGIDPGTRACQLDGSPASP